MRVWLQKHLGIEKGWKVRPNFSKYAERLGNKVRVHKQVRPANNIGIFFHFGWWRNLEQLWFSRGIYVDVAGRSTLFFWTILKTERCCRSSVSYPCRTQTFGPGERWSYNCTVLFKYRLYVVQTKSQGKLSKGSLVNLAMTNAPSSVSDVWFLVLKFLILERLLRCRVLLELDLFQAVSYV